MHVLRMLLAALFLSVAGLAPGQAAPVVLSFAHAAKMSHPAHIAALQFASRVEQRTHGEVRIEIFPGGELGSENEMLQKVRLGAIDFYMSSVNYLIKYERVFALVVMPYQFDSYAHAHRVLDGPAMAWFAPLAEKQGFVLLSNWEWGFRNITNNKRPITTPQDVRGLNIRVPPVLELEATMAALGANVSKISFNELYAALSQGMVDGEENPLNVIYYNKLYEVQKHLALTRHVYYHTVHLVGARTWVKLTPAQQQIVREESRAAGERMRTMIEGEEQGLIAKMEKAGVKVTRPDPAPFRAQTEAARQKIMQFAGEENARKFQKMVEDERKR